MGNEHEHDKKKCAEINVYCGDKGHRPDNKKKDCCDPCEAVQKGYTFVGFDDIGFITPVATVIAAQLLVNPVGSGKILKITKRAMTAIGSDDENVLIGYSFDPQIQNPGVLGTIVCLNQSDKTKLSVAQLYKLPTVASLGLPIDAFNNSSPPFESDELIILGEGHSLLTTFRANAENSRAAAYVYWTECKKHCQDEHDDEPPMEG